MTLVLSAELLSRIQGEAERTYPEEGAGFLLGFSITRRKVVEIFQAKNPGFQGARQNRYMIVPEEYMAAEKEADRLSMDVLGVFHSHPDHPAEPSEFDREWAQPSFSYLITSVDRGTASATRSWLLREDRSSFDEETLQVSDQPSQEEE